MLLLLEKVGSDNCHPIAVSCTFQWTDVCGKILLGLQYKLDKASNMVADCQCYQSLHSCQKYTIKIYIKGRLSKKQDLHLKFKECMALISNRLLNNSRPTVQWVFDWVSALIQACSESSENLFRFYWEPTESREMRTYWDSMESPLRTYQESIENFIESMLRVYWVYLESVENLLRIY